MKLTAHSIRTWDPPEIRAVYWSGASHAITRARDCYGCRRPEIPAEPPPILDQDQP